MRKGIATVFTREAVILAVAAAAGGIMSLLGSGGRQAACVALLCLLLTYAGRLFAANVRRHLALERVGHAGEASRVLLVAFVAYKEGVKAVFGSSLTLAWLAGLLFILERFAGQSLLVPLGLALVYSAVVFALIFAFAALLDAIRYPFRH